MIELLEEAMHPEHWVHAASGAGVFLLAFLSEDSATLSGAVLGSLGRLSWSLAFASCFLGIWLGDLGLYGLARYFGRPVLGRFGLRKATEKLNQSEAWFARHGSLALVICRFVPGTRLPTFLAAGILRMPAARFAAITGILAASWVGLFFAVLHRLGRETGRSVLDSRSGVPFVVAAALALVLILSRDHLLSLAGKFLGSPPVQRLTRWEFWPAWLFYLPIGLNYLRLSIKYRSLSLPTCANPGMFTGGMIGESKQETLSALAAAHPQWVASSTLIREGEISKRMTDLGEWMQSIGSVFPIVLKPDVAQRGSGFKVVRSAADAESYFRAVDVPVIAQKYIPGPLEAGIFFHRFPTGGKGKIFAITEKIFPVISGDGVRSIEELIRADARASILAETYLRRFDRKRTSVLAPGETLRLVEAGNHAQGCIFRDGMHLWSSRLEARIDAISKDLPGFYIGRYDVRFRSVEELRMGEGFAILELNGAASEATSAYDAGKSLREAYAILFQQWELVFAIADENRKRGHRADPLATIFSEWRRYQERSLCHPLAD
ncbi:MAG: VTT domain-containing protein [Terrimicrobiaceae bacterium]